MMRSARSEMEALIERTAMSPFIREKKDYFTAFFTRDGRLLYGTNLPLGGNLLDGILAQYAADTMRPGDLYWYNDCYGTCGGVSHSPDMVFVAPVFYAQQLVGFAEAWGHLWDIGGMMPGSISPAATEIYHEGIIMPPIRIYREGVLNDEVFRIFARNSRFPDILKGDLRAIMASCQLGKQRLEALFQRFGTATTLAAFEALIAQSAATVRRAFAARVPMAPIASRITWTTTASPTKATPCTCVLSKTTVPSASIFVAPTTRQWGQSISSCTPACRNSCMASISPRMIRPFCSTTALPTPLTRCSTRPGSLVHPTPPAPLGMRSNTMLRVNSCVFGTLALATGGQTSAASPVYVIYMLRSLDKQTGTYTLCIEGMGVGFGARAFADGIDSVYYVAQKNYPVEFAEMEFGVRIERYSIHRDSGGPGRYRGGCGVVRDIRIIADEGILASRLENVIYPAWGVNGGHSGGQAASP